MARRSIGDYGNSAQQKPDLNNREAHTLMANFTHSYTTSEKKNRAFASKCILQKTWNGKLNCLKFTQIPIPIIQTKLPLLMTKMLSRWPWTSLSLPLRRVCCLWFRLVYIGCAPPCGHLWCCRYSAWLPFPLWTTAFCPASLPRSHLLQTGLSCPDPRLALVWSSFLPLIPISSFGGYS